MSAGASAAGSSWLARAGWTQRRRRRRRGRGRCGGGEEGAGAARAGPGDRRETLGAVVNVRLFVSLASLARPLACLAAAHPRTPFANALHDAFCWLSLSLCLLAWLDPGMPCSGSSQAGVPVTEHRLGQARPQLQPCVSYILRLALYLDHVTLSALSSRQCQPRRRWRRSRSRGIV
jgi:hypothetical protein